MDQRIVGIAAGTLGAILAASTIFFLVSGPNTGADSESPPPTALPTSAEASSVNKVSRRLKQARTGREGVGLTPVSQRGNSILTRPRMASAVLIKHGHAPENIDRAFSLVLDDLFACEATHTVMHGESLDEVTIRFTLQVSGDERWRAPTDLAVVSGTEHGEFLSECMQGTVDSLRFRIPEGGDLQLEHTLVFEEGS